MKNAVSVVLAFLLAFIVFTVVSIPAPVALQLVQSHIPNNVRLGAVTGTLWQGQISGVRYQNLQFNDVKWQLNGWGILTGQLQGKLNFGNPRQASEISGRSTFGVSLFGNDIELSQTTLRFSVEHAMHQVNLPLPVDAKGRIILELEEFNSGQPYCENLKGDISSPEIQVKGMSGWFSIGDLSGLLSCKSGDIAIVVEPENLLGLRADATLAENMQFKVAGNVKPDASLPKEIHEAVKYLGRPDAEGRYPVSM
ncbi:type II secretion system protein N [Pseudoalteromonas luteoviolacea]|uniref:type II secretion system protein N n=1 Tax=Pseudoalteromonas luteoviolacea TaxID=43657 RepID=UPI001B37E699|nr:type II secretion system protein N [Pseudoalteromonas luteoviolacea]MBQ4839560.1 type II secretion system protein N [Pseudoalteromonas luteoviolacea]